MKKSFLFSILFLALMASCCISCDKGGNGVKDPDADFASLTRLNFEVDETEFPNPERGWFTHPEFNASRNPGVLSERTMEAQRALGRTLIYTIYYLDLFFESPISEDFLNYIKANLTVLRNTGFKCVLRFAYKRDWSEKGHPWDP